MNTNLNTIDRVKVSLKKSSLVIGAFGLTLLGSGGAALAATQTSGQSGTQQFQAVLTPLNGSKATGQATTSIDAEGMAHFRIAVKNLINAPHAQHVHFGVTAAHECPAKTADANGDGVLDTTEGTDAYGPVQTSLTTSGDTSPTSVLAVDRSPTYASGATYDRTFQLTSNQAQEIRSGQGVIVVHGIDSIMPDGKYDGELKSDLEPSLPQEATAPAACGPLHEIAATTVSAASGGNSNSGGSASTNYDTNTSSNASKGMVYIAMAIGAGAFLLSLVSLMRRPVVRN